MKDTYILAIESSCDETAASIVKNAKEIVSNVVATQIDVHKDFGGVIPEVASRIHVENISMVIEETLHKANMKVEDVDFMRERKIVCIIEMRELLESIYDTNTINHINEYV